MLTAADIRQRYIDFFVERGHTHVPSSPLVPPDDPTLLFTTAGMVQFKALYSGSVPLPYRRACSVQKSLRAGGKGSDLENVGRTLRHHTFFEMLGNFSFGDYFKREAIAWGWEFCTDPKWLGLPGERLFPTVFGKPDGKGGWIVDDEAEGFWKTETGNVNAIVRLDEKENFWGPAGDTGACGPCSEIKFFMGTEDELQEYRRLAGSSDPADQERMRHDIVELGDLFLEIWNLVFPQYDQQLDGSRPQLKNRGIDTGMGLERTTTAVQFLASGGQIRTPYETDLLSPLINALSAIAALPYPAVSDSSAAAAALRSRGLDPAVARLAMNACVDHARALTFALSEGVVPSNEGRGYVLRRILRRAARFGRKIGITDPFLWKLVQPVVELMGKVYPEIAKHPDVVEKIIRTEEERFSRTLNQGGEILDGLLGALKPGETLNGDDAYRLYDTYGYPLDLTIEAAEERGVQVDREAFERALAEGKNRARASWKRGGALDQIAALTADITERQTRFLGYQTLCGTARVLALIAQDTRVEVLEEGQAGIVVLDQTPFYAEAGGQIGDRGTLADETGAALFNIEDTQKSADGISLHYGEAQAEVRVGQSVLARVEEGRRWDTMRNHSVTHLMQAALKRIIGGHVTQQGSYVGPEGLRFDFTNPEALSTDTQRAIEKQVNEFIRRDLPVQTAEMSLEEARQTGAIAPFGEKYGARVRVVSMGEHDATVSREFCGGTHVSHTGQIGLFIITGEGSVASGIRRIEAQTGAGAVETICRERDIVQTLSRRLSATPDALLERLGTLQDELKALRRQVEEERAKQARSQAADVQAVEVGDVRVVHREIPGAAPQMLAETWDHYRQTAGDKKTVGAFYSIENGRVQFVLGMTADLVSETLSAPDLVKQWAPIFGGKGGGKPTLARGGGTAPERMADALAALPSLVASKRT